MDQTKSSGSRWYDRSDNKGSLRVSCKATAKRTWGETRSQLDEAVDLAAGTGETPALAILDADDQAFLIVRLTDAALLLFEDARHERRPSRAQAIRDAAGTPTLLRDDRDPGSD